MVQKAYNGESDLKNLFYPGFGTFQLLVFVFQDRKLVHGGGLLLLIPGRGREPAGRLLRARYLGDSPHSEEGPCCCHSGFELSSVLTTALQYFDHSASFEPFPFFIVLVGPYSSRLRCFIKLFYNVNFVIKLLAMVDKTPSDASGKSQGLRHQKTTISAVCLPIISRSQATDLGYYCEAMTLYDWLREISLPMVCRVYVVYVAIGFGQTDLRLVHYYAIKEM